MIKRIFQSTVFLFLFSMNAEAKPMTSEVFWAILEQPLVVAVEVNNYSGDVLKSGKYKLKVNSVSSRHGMTAEIFDIVVSNRELSTNECISIIRDTYSESYKSSVKAKYSHHSAGGGQNSPSIINLHKGQYVHIIPNTYYSIKRNLDEPILTSGIFSMSRIN